MAAHYRNGGLPPWAAPAGPLGDGSVKAPLLPNDYNANSGVTYPPASNAYNSYNSSTQFGAYANQPPPHANNTHSTGLYSHATGATGATGYTGASYHTATNTVSTLPHTQTPPPQSFSPRPQTIGAHSQYTSTTSRASVYDPSNPSNPNHNPSPHPTQYAPPAPFVPTHSGPTPPPHAPVPYGSAPAYQSPTSPKGPAPYSYADTSAGAGGSAPAPAYPGGAFVSTEYPREKGWEYTSPPVGSPPKQ